MGQFIRQSMPFNAIQCHSMPIMRLCMFDESATNTSKDGHFAFYDVNTRAQLAYGQLGAVTGCFRPKADIALSQLQVFSRSSRLWVFSDATLPRAIRPAAGPQPMQPSTPLYPAVRSRRVWPVRIASFHQGCPHLPRRIQSHPAT